MRLKNFYLISKQKIFLWLVFILTMIFTPVRPVRAQFGIEILTAPFVFLAKLIMACVIALPVSFIILNVAQVFLTWAANPALVGGITTNDFVQAGWATVRDFANLFFILIIVAIGIATALRVKQYEVRKTLPRLIAVAILINFSPVICGVFIDAANIIANFFFTAGAGGFSDTLSLAQDSKNSLLASFDSIAGLWSQIKTGELFFKAIAALVFNLLGAFILFLMGILFIVRNLALWLLVILSPLAFLSAVFPKNPLTKKATPFGMWRNQFVKWTFIGVTGSFFLYLTQLMMHLRAKNLLGGAPATETTPGGGNMITNLMIAAVPIIFLYIGYSVTIKSSAMGASAITNLGKKGLAYGKSKAGGMAINRLRKDIGEPIKRSYGTAKGVGKRIGQKVAGRIISARPTDAERQASWEQSTGLARAGKIVARTVVPYKTRERWKAQATAKLKEGDAAKVEKAKAEADKLNTKEGRRAYYLKAKKQRDRETQLGAIRSSIEKGELDGYSDRDIESAMRQAGQINKKQAEDIIEAAPNLAQQVYNQYHQAHPNMMNEYNTLNTQKTTAHNAGNTALEQQLQRQMDAVKRPAEERGLWISPEDIQRYGILNPQTGQYENAFEAKTLLTTKAKEVGKFRKDYVKTERFMNIIQDAAHQGRNAWAGNNLSRMAEEYGTPAVDLYNATSDTINRSGNWMHDIAGKPHHIKRYIKTNPGAIAAGYRLPS